MEINIKGFKIENLIVDCFICGSRVKINANPKTKYWVCPKCKQMNKCENLIRQTIKDTVFDAKIIEKREENETE